MQISKKVLFYAVFTVFCLIIALWGLSQTSATRTPETTATPPTDQASQTESTTSTEPPLPPKPKKICITGDNNLGTYTQDLHKGVKPYTYVMEDLSACDLLIANLETNLSAPNTGAPQSGKSYTFKAPLEALQWMSEVGMDAVSLANNHSMDFGSTALVEQMQLLDGTGIVHFGGGKNMDEALQPKYIEFEGIKIALISMNDIENWFTAATSSSAGTATFDQARIIASLRAARESADYVIVYPHWGEENTTAVNSRQRSWARLFIDNGADLVVGSGPHVRQESEVYNGKQIFYSLGNFAVCGFYFVPEGSTGTMLQLKVENAQISAIEATEIKISFLGLPKLATKDLTVPLYPNDEFKAAP